MEAKPVQPCQYALSLMFAHGLMVQHPDDIVQTLAAPKIKKYYCLAIRLRHNELLAYQMDAHGRYEKIPQSQWENWVVSLDSLTKKLQADEREGEQWQITYQLASLYWNGKTRHVCYLPSDCLTRNNALCAPPDSFRILSFTGRRRTTELCVMQGRRQCRMPVRQPHQ